jgi:hypothetical protein
MVFDEAAAVNSGYQAAAEFSAADAGSAAAVVANYAAAGS